MLAALSAAGIKGHDRLAGLIAGKVCGGAAFVALVWLLLEWQLFLVEAATLRLAALVCAFLLGWRCPEVVLSRLAARRHVRLERGMPDALDLLVICAEAGLASIRRSNRLATTCCLQTLTSPKSSPQRPRKYAFCRIALKRSKTSRCERVSRTFAA